MSVFAENSEFERQGTIDYSHPDRNAQFYQANKFLKEAGEAMALAPESGAKVARLILKALTMSLTESFAKELREALPNGLRQECEMFTTEVPKEDISAQAVMNQIQKASPDEAIAPEQVAKNFWNFFRDWNEKNPSTENELPQKLMDNMPDELADLFQGLERTWPQNLL